MTRKLSYQELISLIENDETSDELLEHYFEIDEDESDCFFPELRINSAFVFDDIGDIPNHSTASRGLIGAFNRRARRKRRKKFDKKIEGGFDGTIIVSEGDSWFQYPIKLDDVIDHLSDKDEFAIRSLGFAGDWLSNILEEEEYLDPIDRYKPKVFLISGGGNDLVGKRRLAWLLESFDPGRTAEEYLGERFQQALNDLERLYGMMFEKLVARYPNMKIIGHGYDHAIPDRGKWLGKPMESIGIKDKELQRQIVKAMIDRFNDMKIGLCNDQVFHVDCRGVINEWHNELHPDSENFEEVSRKFEETINLALNV